MTSPVSASIVKFPKKVHIVFSSIQLIAFFQISTLVVAT